MKEDTMKGLREIIANNDRAFDKATKEAVAKVLRLAKRPHIHINPILEPFAPGHAPLKGDKS